MGHDITAKINIDTEIAKLRIPALNRYAADLFYNTLNAQKYDSGVSGNDCSIFIKDIDVIKKALSKLEFLVHEDYSTFENKEKKEQALKQLNKTIKNVLAKINKDSGTDYDEKSAKFEIIGDDLTIEEEKEKFYIEIKKFYNAIIDNFDTEKDDILVIHFY